VDVVAVGVGRLPASAEEAVYFSALEAIQNAAKHGGPGVHVRVTLEQTDGRLAFEIADDGHGFDGDGRDHGLGIRSMGDRIGAIGGEIRIASDPGRGTTVRGSVPLAGA
jgi:signal transduction histidine kinase